MFAIDDSLEARMKNNPYRCDPEDRVAVLLDVRNITCRQSKDYSNTSIDYSKLLRDAVNGRKCVAAIAVDGVQYDEKGKDISRIFHDELRRSGFRPRLVPASNNQGKQEGVDVLISTLLSKYVYLERCDSVVLITGDGDFAPCVEELQDFGVIVSVISLAGSLSYMLCNKADTLAILDDQPLVRMASKKEGAM